MGTIVTQMQRYEVTYLARNNKQWAQDYSRSQGVVTGARELDREDDHERRKRFPYSDLLTVPN